MKNKTNFKNIHKECSYCNDQICERCLNNKEVIKIELFERFLFVKERYPELYILYIALYGSQNYRMAGNNSDIDCYVIVLPNPIDIFKGKEISKTINYVDGSHITIKDLNTFTKEIKKGSFNIMEFIDPYIKPLFFDDDFINMINYLKGKELIVNPTKMYASISGTAKNLSKKDDPKSLSRLLWLCYFGENLFIREMNFQDAITLRYRDQIDEVRELKFSNYDEGYYKLKQRELLDKFKELYDFETGRIICKETENDVLNEIYSQLDVYISKIYWNYLLSYNRKEDTNE